MWTRIASALDHAAFTTAALAAVLTAGTFIPLTAATRAPFDINTARLAWLAWAGVAAGGAAVRRLSRLESGARRRRRTRLLLAALLVWALLAGARRLLPAGDGLVAEYFRNPSWAEPPAFSITDREPSTATMMRRWAGRPPQQFSVRWVGSLAIPRAGLYTFTTSSDDGSELFIDGRFVVDNRGAHAVVTRSGSIRLERGVYPIVLRYAQFGGEAALGWTWSREGSGTKAVPPWVLSRRVTAFSVVMAARIIDVTIPMAALLSALATVWYLGAVLRDAGNGVLATAVFVAALFVRWPDAQQPFYQAVGRTSRDLNVAVARGVTEFGAFHANLNTPLSGEYVLPASVLEMLAMLRTHGIERYQISDTIAADAWVAQQIVVSAWPRKLERDARARFVHNAEPVPAACRLIEKRREVTLVHCP